MHQTYFKMLSSIANSLTVLPVPIRLAGSSDFYRGRVELYYNGHWGTVCSDNWMLPSSHVVCRQMGLGPALGFQGSGNGLGTTWLNSVTCSGLEQYLASCPSTYSFSSSLTCSHSKDVVVNCSGLCAFPIVPIIHTDEMLVSICSTFNSSWFDSET